MAILANRLVFGRGGSKPYNYLQKVLKTFAGHIVGFWPMSETTGIIANDISGNGCNGSYVDAVTLDQIGVNESPSVDFLGSGKLDIYSTALKNRINLTEGYISLCVKVLTASDWSIDSSSLFELYTDGNNKILARVNGGASVIQFFYVAGGTSRDFYIPIPVSTRFSNIGLRWSKSNDIADVFINGIKQTVVGTNTGLGVWSGLLSSYATLMGAPNSGIRFKGLASYGLLLDYAPSDADILSTVNPSGVLVFEGDSRTFEKTWTITASESINPTSDWYKGKKQNYNAAVSGSTISDMALRSSTANALKLSGKYNVLVVWIGINNNTDSATTIFNAIKSYCQNAKSAGWTKIVLCTEIDAGASGWTAKYQALNVLIKADSSFYDILADLGSRPELQNYTNLTYFDADGTHLIAAGYIIVGVVVGNALSQISN